MSETTDADSRTTVELTADHYDFLRQAGASRAMIRVLKHDADRRNSANKEIKKYVRWGDLDTDENPEDFKHLGGHFFSALWEGDLFGAWRRADLNNKTILREVFGEEGIIIDGKRQGHPPDYVRRMVRQ